ncbi:hypothetical protein EYM_04425 [Ignicoccus islandicus DSM 13165]|uniref:Uncharacterized protein n=1 Tax=Ignicoccus islandicus DSM 13165 TaxID=940295 RepID=A0A0U3E3L2_9CREN|nr:hypothetical protein [Ignicoccus islandicus]ALU12491.1 hypothetical protein EYM_04425 [Ignicoccus islandicus DSM 13165]
MNSEEVPTYMLLKSNLCSAITNYWTVIVSFSAITSLIFIPLVNALDIYSLIVTFLILRSLILLLARLNVTSNNNVPILDRLSGRLRIGKLMSKNLSQFSQKDFKLQLMFIVMALILISLATVTNNYVMTESFLIVSIIIINAGILYTLIEPSEVALPAALWSLGSIVYALVELYYTGLPLVYVLSIIVTSDVFAILGLNAKGIEECVNAMK